MSALASLSDQNKKLLAIAGGAIAVVGGLYFLRRGCCSSARKLDAIVISGPSGVGKGTLITRLRQEHPNSFGFSVSHTTRNPRSGEVDGKDYHFVSKEAIQKMIANNEFLETCDVHGNIYGTSKAALNAVRNDGKVAIIEMDVQGAQKLKKQQGDLHFHYMFVTAPLEELEKRIIKRGADDAQKIKVRLETARREFDFLQTNPSFFGTVLANDDLDAAYAKLLNVLQSLGVKL